jgi:oxygen-dependent protoporphyrinogen oxidase
MNTVAIIGGGITGLTTAFYLKRAGIPVTLYESGNRVGGVIQTSRSNGFLAEHGPNTILETSPRIKRLVEDLNLASRCFYPDPRAEARYLARYRRPIAMPKSPAGFLTTDLFSWRAKAAVLKEPFVPARHDGKEESIGEFVIRRLGQEFLDHAIEALVAGVYAGDPMKLSLTHAFPKLAQLEAKYGSLIKGQIYGARDRKKRGEVSKDRAPKFSFDEGLQVLIDALDQSLGDAVQKNTNVTSLRKHSSGWTLQARVNGNECPVEHCAVIYAGTAFKLADLKIDAVEAMDLSIFSQIRYPPVASVVLGFRREDVAHPCSGFGMLIPKVERFKILGTIFSSSLFPNRAPANHLTLSSYIGGERQPELASLPPAELVSIVCEDLRVLLGARGKPVFQHTKFYPKAIPQYNVGYGRFKDAMTSLETRAPGFFLAGHYRDGVSLGDSIISGCSAVDRVSAYVRSAPVRNLAFQNS